ncbi:uncharacterized protein I303_107056 [Kwoniella dejecticola CBS 10117]|uniref:Uncharacterized protein n=1 Tax=Kwoniella dejecticola CBS 10117 TaxID=1296121 RepID=A0AAJ8MJG5_9TREE
MVDDQGQKFYPLTDFSVSSRNDHSQKYWVGQDLLNSIKDAEQGEEIRGNIVWTPKVIKAPTRGPPDYNL